jgi:hypothetical protein
LTSPLDNLITEIDTFLGIENAPLSLIPNLPLFIQDIPPWLPEEDVRYLETKGIFNVPNVSLRLELLKVFVENVYPFLPVLDLESFLLSVVFKGGAQKVSLLLFHAVMFSGLAFIEAKYLHNAGYRSRKQARKEFFLKARVCSLHLKIV